MSTSPHTALYRKYRPAKFEEVIGQGHIISVLQAEAQKEQPAHAYLFAGSRGTGKTTIARIFAESIGTASEDLYEIDAASNTSVEDIRSLNDAVYTLPLKSKFKVYILDEVHMLSKSAFNAFLKTLEEPPKHVIFILATTELHKIPETIISRCQVFHFKKPTLETLTGVIKNIAKSEGVTIGDKGAQLIAQVGNGSFRDTLSALQSVVSTSKSAPKEDSIEVHIESILGAPSHVLVSEFIDALIEAKDTQKALAVLATVHQSDMDARLFADVVIGEARNRLLQSSGASSAGIVKLLELLFTAKEQIGKTHISVLPLEVAVFKFVA